MSNFVTALKTLPKDKQTRINRLIFNPKIFKENCSLHHRHGEELKKGQKYYTCPQCGFEDKSLVSWRKAQSHEDKWNQFYNAWYKKKKLQKHFKALKEVQAERPLTKEELYAKLEGLKSFSRISQIHLNSISSPDKSVLRQSSTPEKPGQHLDVFGARGRTYYLSTVPEASAEASENETTNVGSAMDSNVFRSSEEFGQDANSGEDLDQGVLEDDDEEQGGLDDTAEMRDDQDLSGQVQEPCQGLPMIAQNYSDEDSEDEILRRDVQAEQEMEEDIQEFNQTLKERRRGTLFKNPSIMPDESLRVVQEPPEDDSNVEPPEDDGDDHGDDNLVPEPVPDLETTQVVQDTTNNIGDILDNDHQVIPGPSGTGGAIQVCQLSDDANTCPGSPSSSRSEADVITSDPPSPQNSPIRRQRRTQSQRAGLTFSVCQFHQKLRRRTLRRVQKVSSVYLSAVIEYLVKEVLDLSNEIAQYQEQNILQPRHINTALRYDQELNQLTKNVIIPESTRD